MFSSLQPSLPRDGLIKPTDMTHDNVDKKQIDIENTATAVDNALVDFDIQESVSKLESDITKTIENNNNKLKELEHLLHEEKKSKHLLTKIIEDDVLPIVENISEEVVTKPASVEKVEEDYVVEDVSLLKKLIAETGKKDGANAETIENDVVETAVTLVTEKHNKPLVDIMTTEKHFVETSTENAIQTTVTLVNTLITTTKVR